MSFNIRKLAYPPQAETSASAKALSFAETPTLTEAYTFAEATVDKTLYRTVDRIEDRRASAYVKTTAWQASTKILNRFNFERCI